MKRKLTVTSIFMVPTIGLPLDDLTKYGYINGFSADGHRSEQYEDSVYLLFKPLDYLKFTEFIETLYDENFRFIDDYDYEGGYVVLVFRLNPAHETDFKRVKESKYSETSKIFQELFMNKVTIIVDNLECKENSLQSMIFNKHEDLQIYWEKQMGIEIPDNQEFWSAFDLEKETLKL
jgi:hypothetical protein